MSTLEKTQTWCEHCGLETAKQDDKMVHIRRVIGAVGSAIYTHLDCEMKDILKMMTAHLREIRYNLEVINERERNR